MKKAIHYVPAVLLFLFLSFAGTILFLPSVLIGLVFRRPWIAYVIALGLTLAVTFYSAAHPDMFRFGSVYFRIHDSVRFQETPSFTASMLVNLIYAWLGVMIGSAARDGYGCRKIEQVAARNGP